MVIMVIEYEINPVITMERICINETGKNILTINTAKPMTKAAISGLPTLWMKFTVTYFETKYKATKELSPTKVNPIAAPFKPYMYENTGTKTQVRVVHIIINLKVRVIFPMAFKVFVKGVVTAAKAEVILKIVKANKAGLHFSYLGII